MLEALLRDLEIEIVSLDREQAGLAQEAWYSYGKGRHPAGLDFGGCCSYALARWSGSPLRFKGDDFGKTGLEAIPLSGA